MLLRQESNQLQCLQQLVLLTSKGLTSTRSSKDSQWKHAEIISFLSQHLRRFRMLDRSKLRIVEEANRHDYDLTF